MELNIRELALGVVGDGELIEGSCKKEEDYVALQDSRFAK